MKEIWGIPIQLDSSDWHLMLKLLKISSQWIKWAHYIKHYNKWFEIKKKKKDLLQLFPLFEELEFSLLFFQYEKVSEQSLMKH